MLLWLRKLLLFEKTGWMLYVNAALFLQLIRMSRIISERFLNSYEHNFMEKKPHNTFHFLMN